MWLDYCSITKKSYPDEDGPIKRFWSIVIDTSKEISLFTISQNGILKQWALPNMDLVHQYTDYPKGMNLKISGNSNYLFIGGSLGYLTQFDIKTKEKIKTIDINTNSVSKMI